ncbi:redoxin domain-containing protein [Paenibacillus sp. LMG 31456]|uniref:Redoxin domain-containing protein n=1 Tax=Paenibacillus foliorum TaxID=2654974 RepID=A0A972GPG0_9BACL|nr:redoxin domain-containing protein [Paenibacillus foliorum]NOU94444.1 redoxin domain-containing protein [Paenibacillus foliorum]
MKDWRRLTSLSVVILIATALLYTLLHSQSIQTGYLKIGDKGPDFTSTTMDGTSIKLSDYRGKGVLLNFWASWCEPCVDEMPRINKAYHLNTSGVEIIAVNVGDSRATARDFITSQGINFPIWLDPSGEAADSYRVTGLPSTFLIDKNGRLVKAVAGEFPDELSVIQLLKSVQH